MKLSRKFGLVVAKEIFARLLLLKHFKDLNKVVYKSWVVNAKEMFARLMLLKHFKDLNKVVYKNWSGSCERNICEIAVTETFQRSE